MHRVVRVETKVTVQSRRKSLTTVFPKWYGLDLDGCLRDRLKSLCEFCKSRLELGLRPYAYQPAAFKSLALT